MEEFNLVASGSGSLGTLLAFCLGSGRLGSSGSVTCEGTGAEVDGAGGSGRGGNTLGTVAGGGVDEVAVGIGAASGGSGGALSGCGRCLRCLCCCGTPLALLGLGGGGGGGSVGSVGRVGRVGRVGSVGSVGISTGCGCGCSLALRLCSCGSLSFAPDSRTSVSTLILEWKRIHNGTGGNMSSGLTLHRPCPCPGEPQEQTPRHGPSGHQGGW